jgi:pimeloyl-ACP methyl ester carboxylesterase
LLIHSINAAGSAYEVRPLYEHYRHARAVYAPDLPGFGFSDRPDRIYTPRLMTDAILAMVEKIQRAHGGEPVDALAISLSSEFLARAAAERPDVFRTLALVSPTGLDRATPDVAEPGSTRAKPWLSTFLRCPGWNRLLFHLLSSRPSMRFFLRKTWGSPQIDEGLLEYDYLTTHQAGARHAPYSFVSGFLFSLDIRSIYRSLSQPIWVAHGVRGDFVDFTASAAFASLPNWRIETFQSGALPHFEDLPTFSRAYDDFLAVPPV